jgi:putative DNA primase/helicase
VQYNPADLADKIEALDACEIAAALGGSLIPDAKGNFICCCPAHVDARPSLAVRDGAGRVLVFCYAGCSQGAVLAALRRLKLLPGRFAPTAPPPPPVRPPRPVSDPFKMWRTASPDTAGSLVELYLRKRLLEIPKNAPLRYAPSLWHWPTRSRHPAMVALIERYDGAALTSHATFLSPEGRKAAITPVRLFPAGANPAGGGVWFDRLGARRELAIAEGIESALSAALLYDAVACVATLSTHGMRSIVLPPAMGLAVRIFADHDAQGHGLNAARDLYRRLRSEGRDVCLSMPDAVGQDANDLLLRRMETCA